jgi:hypothetical protein
MADQIRTLLGRLTKDDWRERAPFSSELRAAQDTICSNSSSTGDREAALASWLQKFQPCLFGRMAAKAGLLKYCILTEDDLSQPDEHIRDKIQAARTEWTRAAFEGKTSGFLILAATTQLALARPDPIVLALAQRLCSLYLLTDIETDAVYLDEIFLEKPGATRITWRWNVGANYFASHGDGRWWQDHRIPGGIGFSMNSVGHMAKSGLLANALIEFDKIVGGPAEEHAATKIDSLPKALEMAMRTISLAADAVSGKATELLPLPADTSQLVAPACPAILPAFLANKNWCTYRGYYHTDITIPSEYFVPNVERPAYCGPHDLDFTYLFDAGVNNPDNLTMGFGRRIRGGIEDSVPGAAPVSAAPSQGRIGRVQPSELSIEDATRLVAALR